MTISPYLTLNKRTERQARIDRAAREFVRDYPILARKALSPDSYYRGFAKGFIQSRWRYLTDNGL